VRHLGITWVNGTFGQWTADLNYDPSKPEAASVTAHIQTASVTTGTTAATTILRQNYLAGRQFSRKSRSSVNAWRGSHPTSCALAAISQCEASTRPSCSTRDWRGADDVPRPPGRLLGDYHHQAPGLRHHRNGFMEGAQIVGDEVRITIDIEAPERATTP